MIMNLTVKQSNSLKKIVKKLTKQQKLILDSIVVKLMENPNIEERKKGDLAFLRVYKFKLLNQEVLLGYTYEEEKIILTLLKLGSHENFYRDIKNNILS